MNVCVECRWAECDKEFHYKLYVNDLFICDVCNIDILKRHLKKNYYLLLKKETL